MAKVFESAVVPPAEELSVSTAFDNLGGAAASAKEPDLQKAVLTLQILRDLGLIAVARERLDEVLAPVRKTLERLSAVEGKAATKRRGRPPGAISKAGGRRGLSKASQRAQATLPITSEAPPSADDQAAAERAWLEATREGV